MSRADHDVKLGHRIGQRGLSARRIGRDIVRARSDGGTTDLIDCALDTVLQLRSSGRADKIEIEAVDLDTPGLRKAGGRGG